MARNVSVGQTVASSLQTPTLFTLATNLTDMQVDTSVDEADIGSVRTGEPAQLTVTAFPNQPFAGTVSQVRVNPTTVQNVVTYDAVVSVHDTSGKLLPGMTAQVNIEVGTRPHVLAVPIAAVLYRPLAAPSPSATSAFGGGGFGAGVVQSSGGPSAGQAVAGAPGSQVTLWLLRDGRPSPVQVVIGLSDGKNIEMRSGDIAEGDPVIVAQYRGAARRAGGGGLRPGTGSGSPSQAQAGNSPAAPSNGAGQAQTPLGPANAGQPTPGPAGSGRGSGDRRSGEAGRTGPAQNGTGQGSPADPHPGRGTHNWKKPEGSVQTSQAQGAAPPPTAGSAGPSGASAGSADASASAGQ